MKGRKPQSTQSKRLNGNPGKRPLNEAEPVVEVPTEAFDVPPAELNGDGFASAEWVRLAPLLRRSRQVSESDRSALIAMCLEWSRYLTATAKVRQNGMVVQAPSGYPIPNPYLSIATKALAGCNKLWPELGLTPSSRSRVSAVPDDGKSDPFSEFDQPTTGSSRAAH